MARLFIYLLLVGCVLYLLWYFGKSQQQTFGGDPQNKSKPWFRTKRDPMEIWVQVFETSSVQEGRVIQARLQEEDLECILYEQGKKNIHGNELPGIGISVPKSGVLRAQNIISRMSI